MPSDPFIELLDAARVDAAAAGRSRERWLRQQAEEEATLTGTLLDLAEQRAQVAVRTTSGRTLLGTISAVGVDFCAVLTDTGRSVLVRLDAVATVRVLPGQRAGSATGDRPAPVALSLEQVLGVAAGDRPEVGIVTGADPQPVRGELRAVGHDVVTLVTAGEGRARCFVPLAAVMEVTLGGA